MALVNNQYSGNTTSDANRLTHTHLVGFPRKLVSVPLTPSNLLLRDVIAYSPLQSCAMRLRTAMNTPDNTDIAAMNTRASAAA